MRIGELKLGAKIINTNYEVEEKTVIPSTEETVVLPSAGHLLSKVNVKPIPDEYVKPSGEITITEQGTFNVKDYETAVVTAPFDKLFNQYMNKTLTQITEKDLEGATSLNANLFSGQTNLVIAEIPDTVTTVGTSLFSSCSNLIRVKLSSNCPILSQFMFSSCTSLAEIVIPEGVIEFGSASFASCSGLRKITIPSTLINIPNNCFAYASVPKDIYVSNLTNFVKVTGQFSESGSSFTLYYNNEKVTNLVLPDDAIITNNILRRFTFETTDLNNIVTIGQSSFTGCSKLTSVTIGDKILQIQASAFSGCTALTSITIKKVCPTIADVPTLANVNAIPTSVTIYVPDENTKTSFKGATNWSSYTIKVIGE